MGIINISNENHTDYQPAGQITPPEGSYFIHGRKKCEWGVDFRKIPDEEISCSLQVDGRTNPIYECGVTLRLDQGSVRSAFARDATTRLDIEGRKVATGRTWKVYAEDELPALVADTPVGRHNELVVDALGVEVTGTYVVEGAKGIKRFVQRSKEQDLPVTVIPRVVR